MICVIIKILYLEVTPYQILKTNLMLNIKLFFIIYWIAFRPKILLITLEKSIKSIFFNESSNFLSINILSQFAKTFSFRICFTLDWVQHSRRLLFYTIKKRAFLVPLLFSLLPLLILHVKSDKLNYLNEISRKKGKNSLMFTIFLTFPLRMKATFIYLFMRKNT